MPKIEVLDFKPLDDKYHHQVVTISDGYLKRHPKKNTFKTIDEALSIEKGTDNPLYKQLHQIEGLWGSVLNSVYRFIDYRDTIADDTEEYQTLNQILILFQKLWTNIYRFNKANGEQLLEKTRLWLREMPHRGNTTLFLDLLESLYLMANYMNLVAHYPPRLMSRLIPMDLIEGYIALCPSMRAHHETILEAHPELGESKEVTLTAHNASRLLMQDIEALSKRLDEKKTEHEVNYALIKEKLVRLKALYRFLSDEESFTPERFFTAYDEVKLKPLMEALQLSESEKSSWLLSQSSYQAMLKEGVFSRAWAGTKYHWGGATITQALLEERLHKALYDYYCDLSKTAYETPGIKTLLDATLSHIEAMPYAPPIVALKKELDALSRLAEKLSFTDTVKQFKCEKKPSFFTQAFNIPKPTTPIITHLSFALEELQLAKKALEQQQKALSTWLKILEDFDRRLNSPLFEFVSIEIDEIDTNYDLLIDAIYHLIVTPASPPSSKLLQTDKLDHLKKHHEMMIIRIETQRRVLEDKLKAFRRACPNECLQMLIAYLANVSEPALPHFSASFESLFSHVFDTLDTLKSEAPLDATAFFEHVSRQLKNVPQSKSDWRATQNSVKVLSTWVLNEATFVPGKQKKPGLTDFLTNLAK